MPKAKLFKAQHSMTYINWTTLHAIDKRDIHSALQIISIRWLKQAYWQKLAFLAMQRDYGRLAAGLELTYLTLSNQ